MPDMDQFLEMFFVECDELLESLATGLRAMEAPEHEKETVHSVFRAVHSMKGAAAAFGLNDLVTFAHRFETVLDLLRSDRLIADEDVMTVLHRASDLLADLVSAARQSRGADQARISELLEELDRLIGDDGDDGNGSDLAMEFVPLTLDFAPLGANPATTTYKIIMAPDPELYRTGNDPAALITALAQLGDASVTLNASNVPKLSIWSQDEARLKWEIDLSTAASVADIHQVFEFVVDCCQLEITQQVDDTPKEAAPDVTEQPEKTTQPTPDAEAISHKVGDGRNAVSPSGGTAGHIAQSTGQTATIRVSLDRVDKLMNMIGELVIKEAMLYQVIETAGFTEEPDVVTALEGIRQLAGDIQESVMSIRAQPLKLVFQRMHRILREAAEATGKKVRLESIGENTEVDKTMIERLIDPLTHMIRNSIDHGLEDALTRQRRGKPHEGTITLSAAHRSGRVQIEVSDDGGGINRERVRQIAEERGLIPHGATLSPNEVDSLLFLPGFSSKEEVSALSGRGVGLDVVRREIMSLGGRVMIQSKEGHGTTFSIALPLTLAVLEGMLIQLRDQTMVLPITAVQETLRPTSATLHGIGKHGRVLSNRGELIPIIDLACAFGLRDTPAALDGGVLIVVETDTHKRAALHVDGIFDQRQVVIKSLEENYGRVPGVSAATILGDGKIALIIDPEEIVLSSLSEHGRSAMAFAANG
ncbi:chemotaxis protein CheA [Roseinatronobacter sp. S2]|uniref:chemotaxis protein CheA n=1 Tax=Roseinatronobacter sp. S2 TaxID=3035471 RepID=UPI00240F64DE|nr:chemotaxis protein CheA [Roseinatronobacter sp. S2]WFE74028.1 chemotaxis protein CheA [Roseinatronobacter sp. S2]